MSHWEEKEERQRQRDSSRESRRTTRRDRAYKMKKMHKRRIYRNL
jgi:hypothetical protein